ncbi:hypothetical protein ACU617_23580 [Klebsiella aerogenes]
MTKSTITRERLQEIAEDGFLKHGESKELARMALAAMDSEPVGYFGRFDPDDEDLIDQCSKNVKGAFPLYRHAQPAPVVPVEMNSDKAWGELKISAEDCQAWSEGWNACRAAMLQAEPVTTANKLGNSPVIPDGWKLVPVEPNGDMLAAAQDAYGETDGDIASTLRAAMIAAAQPAPTIPVTDAMAYAFHHALTDGPLGDEDVEDIKTGLQAAFSNVTATQPALVVQDGYVMVPMRLTAENGAKVALSGEFSETKFVNCPECFGDDECETCDGSGRIEITVPVTWTTIKEIWAKGVEHFAAASTEE